METKWKFRIRQKIISETKQVGRKVEGAKPDDGGFWLLLRFLGRENKTNRGNCK